MKTKFVLLILLLLIFFAGESFAKSPSCLSITGLVKQPLNLTVEDLERCQSISVQLNEVTKAGAYRGVFYYSGVPLRTLLELASIEKEETAFKKKVDLAILVRNRQGKQVAISWGEVFYRNPGGIIVATSAVPIMPHHDCKACHKPEVYKSRLDQLHRKIGFPKLVVSHDTYADRSLDEITSIEIVDLHPEMPTKRMKELFSPQITVTGAVDKPLELKDLSPYPRMEMTVKHLGEGKGFHGLDKFEGTGFKTILEDAGIKPDLTKVFMVSAPDGYRSLFSYGEIFLNPAGERIFIADRIKGQPIEKFGKFFLVPPDDLMSDRDVKSVEKIEVISIRQDPRLYVIGTGSGDTSLISLEAISYMAKADVFVCPPDIRKDFAKYMGDKPILFDLYEFTPYVVKKENPGLSQAELNKLLEKKLTHAVGIINAALNEKKTVAILDYGDPTIWSGSGYIRESFKDSIVEIIPGLSSFNVANALLKRHIGCNGSIILSTPQELNDNRAMLEALAKKGETLCIFMGIKDLPDLVPLFKKFYAGSTPACLAYKAGYSGSEHLIRTTLDGLVQAAESYHEKYLGLIYIGPCLATNKAFEH
jgi:precorrin-4 methylase